MKAGIATALEHAEQLHAVLEEEFQALTIDDIDGFEKLQPAKNELLAQLTGYVQTVSQQPPAPPAAGEDDNPAGGIFFQFLKCIRNRIQYNIVQCIARFGPVEPQPGGRAAPFQLKKNRT